MRRGTFPQAAGRNTPGTTPLLAQPQIPSRRPLSAPVKPGQRSALTVQPLRSPYPISNRNFQQLEIAVTPTKHSPELFLIDNKKQLFRKIACRAGCLPTIKPALSKQLRRLTTIQSTNCHPTNPAISNRNWIRLEIAVTNRKHSSDPSPIDNESRTYRRRIRTRISLFVVGRISGNPAPSTGPFYIAIPIQNAAVSTPVRMSMSFTRLVRIP